MTASIRDPGAHESKLEHMYTTKDPLCNISGGWELYLTSHRVRKADKASIHYLQSITTPWYFVAFLWQKVIMAHQIRNSLMYAIFSNKTQVVP